MSQLALAHEAGVSPRHVSFVESGRASPSREMVLSLARALDVPLRERNHLLLAAGYAPVYRETALDDDALASGARGARPHARAPRALPGGRDGSALEHRPSQRGRPIACSRSCSTARAARAGERPAADVHRAAPLRHQLGADRRGADPARPPRGRRRRPRPADQRYSTRCSRYPGVPRRGARPTSRARRCPSCPSRSPRTASTHYFSMVTTLGTPQDVTLQEIRIESFFPADAATAAHRWH